MALTDNPYIALYAPEPVSGSQPEKGTKVQMATVSKAFLADLTAASAPDAPTYPDRWDPEGNPVIAGAVVSIEEVKTANGVGYRVTLDDVGPDKLGEISFFQNTVLRNLFEKQEIEPGDVIGIKFLGEAESKSGRTYKNYVLKVCSKANPAEADDSDPFEDE